VAQLANLSTTYYTFLEQGRPVRPSPQVLDALAAALRMSPAERDYLETLAHGPPGAAADQPAPEQLDPCVIDLVRRLDPYPTFVKGRPPATRRILTSWP
jgi:transcriptional regulator with XRE-family HTH domain